MASGQPPQHYHRSHRRRSHHQTRAPVMDEHAGEGYVVTDLSDFAPPGMSDEDMIALAQRLAVIHSLPVVHHQASSSPRQAGVPPRECSICMAGFVVGEAVRFLPCLHSYHW